MTGPYKIGTLARLTGFSPALLRAWERRYGLFSPGRGTGGQRLFDDDDLAVLRRVRALVDEGRSIGEIAALGRGPLIAHALAPSDRSPGPGAKAAGPEANVDAWRRRLVDAALALDAQAVSALLDELFAVMAPERAVGDVVAPVAIEIGHLWAKGECSIASEHLASAQFLDRIGRLLGIAQPLDPRAPRVVAACFPGEQHQLGLMILGWHVARRGARIVYLGAALPIDELADACRSITPAATLLSVTRPALYREHGPRLGRVVATVPAGQVFVGGQGVPPDADGGSARLRIVRQQPLTDTVSDILAGLQGPARPAPTRPRR